MTVVKWQLTGKKMVDVNEQFASDVYYEPPRHQVEEDTPRKGRNKSSFILIIRVIRVPELITFNS